MAEEASLQSFHRKLQKTAAQKGIPIFGGFEITPRCNLSCRMCYVKFKGADNNYSGNQYAKGELTARQWIELGRAARDAGMLVVFLTGGEPLIRADFKEIYGAYSGMGFRLNFFTNGTLITEEFAKWLSQSPPASVDVTLYGASGDTYLRLCGQKSAYKRTINGIELLLKYNINTRIKTTIVHSNVDDYKEIEKIARDYGLVFLQSSLVHGNRTRGIEDIASERLSPEEMYEYNVETICEYDSSPVDIEKLRKHYKELPPMFCSAGRSSFFINWRGELVPCPLFNEPYGEPLKSGFKNAWEELREEVKKIPGLDECKSCEYRIFCPVCPGKLYLETGKFDGHSDYMCGLAKEKSRLYNETVKRQ